MIPALHVIAAVAYLGGWAIDLRAFRAGEPAPGGAVRASVAAGVALHLAGLGAFIAIHGTLPLVGLGPASSTLAFLIGTVALAASLRSETRAATLFLLPPLLLLLGEALLVGVAPAEPRTSFRGPWFVVHVGAVFAGYAGLLLASAASAMYLLQFRALKRKRFGSAFRFFPSLESLDDLNRRGLVFGFPIFTLGLVAGWSWTLTYGGTGMALENPQVVLGIVTWVAYLTALVVRFLAGGRDHPAAVAGTLAFVCTAAAFALLRMTADSAGFFL